MVARALPRSWGATAALITHLQASTANDIIAPYKRHAIAWDDGRRNSGTTGGMMSDSSRVSRLIVLQRPRSFSKYT
jgi:hypothetical protein